MARTIKSIILSTLKAYDYDRNKWVSPGELFDYACTERSYMGTQEELLQRADDLAKQGLIESRRRGREQNNCYRRAQTPPSRRNTKNPDPQYPRVGAIGYRF